MPKRWLPTGPREGRNAMVITDVGYGLAALIAAGIMAIGLRFLLAPERAAAGFGVPAGREGNGAYLAAKGIRDIVSGIFVVILLAAGMPHVLAWFLLAAALIPAGDMIVVLRHRGPKATAYGVHGVTIAVLLAAAALLFI
jgi:hypothetical protein